jgi:hypothetical protein
VLGRIFFPCRKLAGLGYHRSAKKCKEKFENVHKYYKRTKDAHAGRQDGKSYRFFSQLEALHAAAPQPQPPSGMTTVQAGPHHPMALAWTAGPTALGPAAGAGLPDLSFSSMSGSESEYDSDDDDDDDAGEEGLGRGEYHREMMAIFEGMMKQVTDKQDAMQRVFLETLERWEAERRSRSSSASAVVRGSPCGSLHTAPAPVSCPRRQSRTAPLRRPGSTRLPPRFSSWCPRSSRRWRPWRGREARAAGPRRRGGPRRKWRR